MSEKECQRCGSVGGYGCYECTPEDANQTDLVQSQIDASVAAEREACAEVAQLAMEAADEKHEICGNEKYAGYAATAEVIAKRIRARGDTDALAERDARVRAEALREAAKTAEHFYEKGQVTKPSDILALIPEKGDA